VPEYLLGDPMLRGDGRSVSSGGDLIPHKGILNEAVELRKHESSSLLLLRDPVILGARHCCLETDLAGFLALLKISNHAFLTTYYTP
jgi:hypothetical protein